MGQRLSGKRAVVFGLAKSGLSALRLLEREGARLAALDNRTEAELGPLAAELRARGVALHPGPTPDGLLREADLVVVSPGVPLALPELRDAEAAGVEVIGEVELASRFLPEVPFVGITGTNGKSTTTALTGALFQAAGRRAFVGGNLGLPLSEAALSSTPYHVHVVELSSFQLEGIRSVRVNAAALLNLTPDHLDRYPSHAAYGEAKARILLAQAQGDVAVANARDAAVTALASRTRGTRWLFSSQPGSGDVDEGAVADGEGGFLLRTAGAEGRFVLRNRALRGRHNLENAMAAALLAHASGLSLSDIQRGLDAYPGLPHRLELVRELEGVEWVNDSKATNVDSTLVALAAFPANVWLIAGGKGKGASYAPMVDASRGRVKAVLTVGQDAPVLAEAYAGVLPVHACGTLEGAVRFARENARAGDVVLLSPACASFDQFRSFEHRGDTFKALVGALR
ncbi:MAG: UDP-N-acetylmuramoyl-L-alanine--D-glutamate ligase [Myxococcaceae bacterium]|nr:UDP-N-acetylmuramoyl-L-alanine--D-glutamate ligase [Myxococcaceae bacterium]